MNLSDYQNYLAINHDAENTRKAYLAQVNKFFRYTNEFTQENLNTYFKTRLEEGIKKVTFNFIINALKSYAKYLKLNIEWPRYKTPNKGVKDFITEEELNEVLPYMDILFIDGNKRKLILKLLFYTGLRPKEITRLKKTDFNFEKKYVIARDTKDKEDRITIFIPNLYKEIKSEIEKSNTEYALNINLWYIREIFEKINKELHYKKHIHAYMLRHGFGHKCIKDGVDIFTLQKMMGHWDINMTKEYLNLTSDEVIENALKNFKYNKQRKEDN